MCVMICCRLCLSASGSLWKLHYVRFPPVSRCSYLELHYLFCSSVFLCLFFFLFGYKWYRTIVSVDGDLLAWLLFPPFPRTSLMAHTERGRDSELRHAGNPGSLQTVHALQESTSAVAFSKHFCCFAFSLVKIFFWGGSIFH